MSVLFFIIFTLFVTTTNAQENTQQALTKVSELQNVTDKKTLKKAKSIIRRKHSISMELANEVIRISESKNNAPINAQAHTLLGNTAKQSKKLKQASHHFLKARLLYKNINDKHNQIMSSIDYINILIDEKNYEEAHTEINELLPIALNYGKPLLMAFSLITQANNYYQQKDYKNSIEQYTQAVKYLSSNDKTAQKHLGETYKKIAQSHKRIKNKTQTALFYKKALDVYTSLHNKKLMARTLNTLAEAERHLGNLLIALEYSIRGLEIHKQVNDPVGYNKALVGAGIIYRHIGRYEKSLKHIYKAHLYYKKNNNAKALAKTSNELGFIYSRLKQFDQARAYYQMAIDLSGKKIDSNTLASALREMAVIDLNAGDYESAMVMAKQAHEIYIKKNDKSKGSLAARIIANIYRAQKDDKNAITYYRESLALATEIKSIIYQIKAQTALAGIIIYKNTNEAISLLEKSVELSTQYNHKSQTLYAYRKLVIAQKLLGNITEALGYAELEIALTDVIQKENDDNQLILAKANLYSHKMEVELESLREKAIYAQLELSKKNNEIEIAEQTRTITELELIKNKYANITLVLLLGMCVLSVIFTYRRFIASKKRNKELDYLAARDPLTNCYNRRVLFEHMKQDFSNIEELDQYCIIMVDIDHFKKVNDTYGHSSGDSVLSSVANILQSCVRQDDIVARFGGEEFCIVLHQVSQNQVIRIAEIMRKKVEKSRFEDISVTCSFGATSIEFKAKTPAELIEQADLALYQSKSLGRNQVTIWNETFNQR